MSRQISSTAQIQRKIATSVATHGFAVIPVGYGECSVPGCFCSVPSPQPWTYSIGLVERGQAELVLLGLDPLSAHAAMSWVAERADMGFSVPVDAPDPLDDLGLKLVGVPSDWLANDPGRMAAWFNNYASGPFSTDAPQVHQLLWADDSGRFPDDARCDPTVVARQPVLANDPWSYPRIYTQRINPARHRKKPRR